MITSGATLDERVIQLDKFDIVKYQLMHYCFINKVRINDTELNLLALMGEWGQMRMTLFCEKASKKGILASPQAVNTCLGKLGRSNLFVKEGVGKKKIFLNPKLKIHTEGNIVFSLKLIKVEANKITGTVQKNSLKAELA